MVGKLDVESILKAHAFQFESRPFYSIVGDCIHFYFENVDHFADRVDCWLTVYKAFDDDRMIGFKLKNIKALIPAAAPVDNIQNLSALGIAFGSF